LEGEEHVLRFFKLPDQLIPFCVELGDLQLQLLDVVVPDMILSVLESTL
jgi:hypothetical protein